MKIGIFTETYIPNTDGVVTSILSFQQELEKRGHEVYVFAPGKENADGETTFWYKSRCVKTYPDFPVAAYPSIGRSRTLHLVKEKGIEIIHLQSPGPVAYRGLRVAQKLGLPVVMTYHTDLPRLTGYLPPIRKFPVLDHPAKRLVWLTLSWFFYKCDAVIAPGEGIVNELMAHCGRRIRKMFVVPNGIMLDKFQGGDGKKAKKKHGMEKSKIVLCLGRVVKEKRLETIIAAAPYVREKIPEVKFLVVGKGPALEDYKRMAKEANVGDAFVFAGYVPDEELRDYYAAADVFATASDSEIHPLTIIEAFASGNVIVGANARGISEHVKDGYDGFLFKPLDAKECADAIIKGLSASAKGMGKNARKSAEKYTVDACTDRLLAVYKWAIAYRLPALLTRRTITRWRKLRRRSV